MKKSIKFLLVLCITILASLIITSHKCKAEETINDGVYVIKSAENENYVLDITGVSDNNCANVEIWSYNKGKNQQFYIKSVGDGYYTIKAMHSEKYLDVAWASKKNGANVEQYEFNGNDNQKWLIKYAGNECYYIVSACNDLYLDVAGGIMNNGTNVLTWENNGGINQKFKIELFDDRTLENGTYKIATTLDDDYVVDVTGASLSECANIELWRDNDGNNQKFKVKSVGNGYYTINCVKSEKCLDVEGNRKSNGTNVIQFNYGGVDNQKWLIKHAGNDEYYIVSKSSGLYLDVAQGIAESGTNILVWEKNGKQNQKFKFIPTVPKDEGRSANFKVQHPDIKVGIDVSYFQGKIDWSKVKKDGIDYAMIRAGFRGYGSSGSLNGDSMFDENVRGARAEGLDVGVYFFSQAKNYEEGVKEAQYTIDIIKKYDITYPVAFDTEASSSPTNSGRADNISVQDRTDATRGFCETIEKAGYKTLIYASPYWLENKLDLSQLSKYKVWLANYTGATQEDPLKRPSNYKGDYVMWQYTSSGTVEGISGSVDCDIYYYLEDN